ncbi:Thaumatin-like protein 1a [Theobroma cacao]|uniref:Thaumatin-like protein 1a n=1 Tax=Theobroma cacao TaxID=3641 RepID=A0A061EUA4_THECC|nr:Thaumatin-like protein 1a [Theobroma cacao]
MEVQVIFAFALAIFFFYGAQSATFTFTNNCPYTVWPATLTGAGPQLSSTGFELASKASSTLNVPAPWTGRFWARTQCANTNGKFECATADCGSGQVTCNGAGAIPQASLIEFTLAANSGQDFYDVSLVDGFNLPLSVTPQGGSDGCSAASCPANVNAACPPELQVKGSDGAVIACKSACLAFNQPQYCCTGAYNSPNTCQPTIYSKIFKSQCPQAYSYAFDDKSSTFTCTGGANYLITFCPRRFDYVQIVMTNDHK